MTHYEIFPARAIYQDVSLIPDVGGMYGFALADPAPFVEALDRVGLGLDVVGLGHLPLIYIGASGQSLRSRVAEHLANDAVSSALRQSLGAILRDDLDLTLRSNLTEGQLAFEPDSEARLTAWMVANLLVTLLPGQRPVEAERRSCLAQDPNLPIPGRRVHDTAWAHVLLHRNDGQLDRSPESGGRT